MAHDNFRDSCNKTCVSILEIFIENLKERGFNLLSKFDYMGEFTVFRLRSAPSFDGKELNVFIKPDGLLELQYKDAKQSIDWSQLYFEGDSSDYFSFENDLMSRLQDLDASIRIHPLFESLDPSLSARLKNVAGDINPEFDRAPSEIYATWQQSRGRDAVHANVKRIPHLG